MDQKKRFPIFETPNCSNETYRSWEDNAITGMPMEGGLPRTTKYPTGHPYTEEEKRARSHYPK